MDAGVGQVRYPAQRRMAFFFCFFERSLELSQTFCEVTQLHTLRLGRRAAQIGAAAFALGAQALDLNRQAAPLLVGNDGRVDA